MLVNLHILGVQKAGTTALASFLNQHPAIHVVKGKEAHVFDDPNFFNTADKHVFAQKKYHQRLTQYQHQPIICDATPITLFKQPFLQDCYQYNPQAKFIVMLRDPVERAISHYQMTKGRNKEPLSMFLAFLLEPIRMLGIKKQSPWPFDSSYRKHSYLIRGRYSQQLNNLFKTIPAAQVLVLNQQDLKHHHQKVMRQIFEFLDIPRHEIKPETVFSTPKVQSSKTDVLAKIWAKLYFFICRENSSRWHKIIKQKQ